MNGKEKEKRVILEGRGAVVPKVGIDAVGGGEEKGTDPDVDETLGGGMGYGRVAAISRTEILVHSFSLRFLTTLLLSTFPLLSKPLHTF